MHEGMRKQDVQAAKGCLHDYAALLRWQAAWQPQKVFLVADEEKLTYDALWRRVAAMAVEASFLGVRGDILVLADDFIGQLVSFLALQAIGARPILLHHGMEPEEVRAVLWENGLQGIWRCAGASHLFEPSGLAERAHGEADVLGVLSSGSTGTPKVMYRTYASWAGFFPVQDDIFRVCADTVMFLHGSLSFTGNMNSLLSVLYEGGTVVTSGLMRCRHWEDLMRYHGVNCLYLVPTKLHLLGRAMRGPYAGVSTIFTGSQLLTPDMLRQLQAVFPAARILLYYGASELNYITYAVCDDPERDSANLGRPFPGIGVSIGADGLIYVTTPYHVSGIEIPFSVKDTGSLNERGELIFGGRREAWINKGGVKINTVHLELALKALPGIADAVVLPVCDARRGDTAAAFLVPENGAERPLIRHMVRHAIKPVEVPDVIVLLPHLPLNDRGKIDRTALHRILGTLQKAARAGCDSDAKCEEKT